MTSKTLNDIPFFHYEKPIPQDNLTSLFGLFKHICIDDDPVASARLSLTIAMLGLVPEEITTDIFGYKTETETDIIYLWLNTEQHQILQNYHGEQTPCEIKNDKENYS